MADATDSQQVVDLGMDSLLDAVESQATRYQGAIAGLQKVAEGSGDDGEMGNLNIVEATVKTTEVQLTQSLLEMTQGIAKNASDWVKRRL